MVLQGSVCKEKLLYFSEVVQHHLCAYEMSRDAHLYVHLQKESHHCRKMYQLHVVLKNN